MESPMPNAGSKPRNRTRAPSSRRDRAEARSESAVAIIDRQLFSAVRTTLDGQETAMTVLAAIVLQLLQKAMAGDVRAHRVLLKYAGLARRNTKKALEIKFLDNAYTEALANGTADNGQE
jgi:hypothetical protein